MFVLSQPIDHVLYGIEDALATSGDLLAEDTSAGAFFLRQLPFQFALITMLAIAITLLGWWKKVGIRRPRHLVYLIPPLLIIALMAIGPFVLLEEVEGADSLLDIATPRTLMLVALYFLCVGITEELAFRGTLLNGLFAHLSAEMAAVIGGLAFGLFHFINLLVGQDLGTTFSQVLNVTSGGILYAALFVHTRSIFPVIILHVLWNMSLGAIMLVTESEGYMRAIQETPEEGFSVVWPIVIVETVYALFIVWRYRREKTRELQGHLQKCLN